jgi:hypothetical protein
VGEPAQVAVPPAGRFALRDLFAATFVLAACLPFTTILQRTPIPLAVSVVSVGVFLALELFGVTRPREVRGRAFYYAYYVSRVGCAYFVASGLALVALVAFPPQMPEELNKPGQGWEHFQEVVGALLEILAIFLVQLLLCLLFAFIAFVAALIAAFRYRLAIVVAVVTSPGAALFVVCVVLFIASALGAFAPTE